MGGYQRVTLLAVVLGALLCPSAVAAVDQPATPSDRAYAADSQSRRAEPPFELDLAGQWRFRTGDDMAWADPAFDDSSWESTQVPQPGGQAAFKDYDGFGWYRLSFTLPAEAAGTPLVAVLGGIDDADETYLNGQLIGHMGRFPPNAYSQWFDQRLYPVPGGAARFGERNVLAVRIHDMNGQGGWYRGPVGLFAKKALRSVVYGLDTSRAGKRAQHRVKVLLRKQARAVRTQKWDAYRRTLSPDFFHDGDTRDRRIAELRSLTERFGPLELRDTEVEVVRDNRSGAFIADTNRSVLGHDASGGVVVVQELHQDFLYFKGKRKVRELGNRSRFFVDSMESRLEGRKREFAVYLPPSYLSHPERRYPTVYLLHGLNGGPSEWGLRNIQGRVDQMIQERGLAESIVVMPDGAALWYVDSSEAPWRSMFTTEMLPFVDATYRTLATRGMRGLTGFSMGGQGAFTVGWSNPDLFSSIASHMGTLNLPPLAGTTEDRAAHAGEAPLVQAATRSTEFLSRFRYFFDACEDDGQSNDSAVRAMAAELTAKQVPYQSELYPSGGHTDTCWVPQLYRSFQMHSDNFRAHGLQ
jgi:enterochelin esterase-like enzyme